MPSSFFVLDACLAVVAVVLVQQWWSRIRQSELRRPFPPGPRALPLLGNLFDMPSSWQWRTFTEWKHKWGDICSVTVLGQRIVILNSVESAVDLLERRSGIYSDRPTLTMAGELMAWSESLSLSPYGDRFRDIRKLLHRYLGSKGQLEKMIRFHDLEERETRRFLVSLLRDPARLVDHIRKTAGAVILEMAYGYEVEAGEDPLVEQVDRAVAGFIAASSPGAFLVDTIPALRWLPAWLPGMAWKRQAAVWRAETLAMCNVPFDMAKKAVMTGISGTNFVSDNIGDVNTPLQEYHLNMAAGSLYSGGADTTVSAITTFFLNMARNPDAQKKAQRELDDVIGNSRLPTIADRDNLPYVQALVSEVLRIHPIAPTGIPHRSIKDDTYRGYFIPKGSVLIANIWSMLRDPTVYSDPAEFRPERFLRESGKPPERDPRSAVFGFGRRICPGVYPDVLLNLSPSPLARANESTGLNLAELSLFTTCAMTLAVFNITKAVENGKEVTPELAYSTGTISHPLPFKCSIKPRSPEARALILELAL